MKQGRKSKDVLMLACALALLLAVLAPAAALAGDPAATQEYQVDPNANVGGGSPPRGGDDLTGGSSGGGASLPLIALAAIAAACTGVAIWRLRRPEPPADPGPGGGSTGIAHEPRPTGEGRTL